MFKSGLFIGLLAWCLLGCDDTFVDPFENEGRYFTVFGYLDILEIDHVIRVIPITRQSAVITRPSQPEAFIDAKVFTTNLDNDITVEWDHSLELLDNNTYGHLFRQSFVAQPGATYRLDVVRSDGITVSATATMPYIPDSTFFNLSPVEFFEDSTRVIQNVHMPSLNTPWSIEAIYRWTDGLVARRVFVPYGREGRIAGDGGWSTTLSISDDQKNVRAEIRKISATGALPDDKPIILSAMGLRIRIINPNWDLPLDILDPEVYAFPQTLSNIQNGYGFFGALGYYIQEWNACELSGSLGYEPAESDCEVR